MSSFFFVLSSVLLMTEETIWTTCLAVTGTGTEVMEAMEIHLLDLGDSQEEQEDLEEDSMQTTFSEHTLRLREEEVVVRTSLAILYFVIF